VNGDEWRSPSVRSRAVASSGRRTRRRARVRDRAGAGLGSARAAPSRAFLRRRPFRRGRSRSAIRCPPDSTCWSTRPPSTRPESRFIPGSACSG
jgi:hypothetical protein